MQDYDKIPKQLASELARQKARISELETMLSERLQIEEENKKLLHDIDERNKKLNCLYGIARLLDIPGITIHEILQRTVELIPHSWQYPDIACARICVEDREYASTNFKTSNWQQRSDIIVQDNKVGSIEVYYQTSKDIDYEGPFQKEERKLLDAIAERLGNLLEKDRSEKALEKNHSLFESIIDSSIDSIYVKDSDGKYLFVNDFGAEVAGMPAHEFIGKTELDFDFPDITHQVMKEDRSILETGKALRKEETLHGKVWSTSKAPLRDSQGRIWGVVGVSRDITDRKQAEEEIRESRERLLKAQHVARMGFLDWNLKTNDLFLSEEIYVLYGLKNQKVYSSFELVDLVVHPDDIEFVKENLNQAIQGSKNFDIDHRIVRPDGTLIWVHAQAELVCDSKGNPDRLLGTVVDITDRKKIEMELKKAQFFTDSIIQSMPGLFYIFEKESAQFVRRNDNWTTVTGYTGEELDTLTALDFFSPGTDRDTCVQAMQVVYSDGYYTMENDLLTKNGTKIRYYFTGTRIVIDEKIYLAGMGIDISERMRAEKAIAWREEKFRMIFNNAAVSFWEYDYSGLLPIMKQLKEEKIIDYRTYFENKPEIKHKILSAIKLINVNKTTLKMYGAETKEEILSQLGKHRDPRHYHKLLDAITAIFEGKQSFECETVNETLDGRQINVLLRMIFSFSPLGENMALVTATDITEMKRLEHQLQIRERMDSIGTLAGGIAHDFNNLLVAIMGNIDLLRMESHELTKDQNSFIDDAYRSTLKAAKLIREIQSLSGGTVYETTNVDIYDVAHDVFSILERTTDRLIEKEIDFNQGEFYITGRAVQMHQVFLNLGTNAIHAIEQKGAQYGDYIKISALEYESVNHDRTGLSEGRYIHILFEDTGAGMSDDVKKKAFDPLFTTKELGTLKGQGLGLAMVYNIITRNHNGFIDIETKENRGTTFHIYLPKAEAAVTISTIETSPVTGGNETILIIDDDEAVRKLVVSGLQKFGYSFLTAEDGQSGLEIFSANKETVDLVILDLTMPRMSGEMFLDRIMKIDPDTKIIISSGHSMEKLKKYTQARGFVTKPYGIKELAETVRNVLDT